MNELHAEAEAAFALELLRNNGLREASIAFDRNLIFLVWREGYFKGQMIGIDKAKELFAEPGR